MKYFEDFQNALTNIKDFSYEIIGGSMLLTNFKDFRRFFFVVID